MSRGLDVLLLTLGGALGTNARYWLAVWMSSRVDPRFPWATFTINVSGSFAIGLLATLFTRWIPSHHARLFFLVGFLGGFTTFSTFALESQVLWEQGRIARSLANMVGSVAAGFAAVVLGVALARAIIGPERPATVRVAEVAGEVEARELDELEQVDA
jgi:fluoride exporter